MSLYGHLFLVDFKQDVPCFKYNPMYTGAHDIYVQADAGKREKPQGTDSHLGFPGQSGYAHIGYIPENVVDGIDIQAHIQIPEMFDVAGLWDRESPHDDTAVKDSNGNGVGTDVEMPSELPDKIIGQDTKDISDLCCGLDISEITGENACAESRLVPVLPPAVHRNETRDFMARMEGRSVVGKLLADLSGDTADNLDSIIKDLEEPGECLYCGGSGRTRESEHCCPHCGRRPVDGTLNRNTDALQLMGIYVPASYRQDENKFDVDRILAKFKDESVISLSRASLWLRSLGFILDKIKNKDLKGGQTILGVHASMDNIMYQWMYSGIMAALDAGFSTSAILNPLMIDVCSFPDMFRDILFFELLSLDYAESFRKLEYICKQRAHHDKPTFIVTNLHLKDLDSVYPVSSKAGVFQAITSYTYTQEYRLAPGASLRNRRERY